MNAVERIRLGDDSLVNDPFTTRVRITMILLAVVLAAAGVTAVFLGESEAGAAALLALGVGLGVLALIGPYVEVFKIGTFEAKLRTEEALEALDEAVARATDEAMERAAEEVGLSVSTGDKSGALRRAEAHASLLAKASVLWVDDKAGQNDAERRMLTSLGVSVDIATNNDEAVSKLERRYYDCVVSDIGRPEGEATGLDLVKRMEESVYRWLIFYITDLDRTLGTPRGAHGITNRPDHLLHYVLDAVERERFESTTAGNSVIQN